MVKPRLLLVEPNQTSAAYIRRLLEQDGYAVTFAFDGKRALAEIIAQAPEAVILELELPDFDGLELVRRVRENPVTKALPLIGLTTRNQPEDTLAGLEAGLTEYIVKQADAIDSLRRMLRYLVHPDAKAETREPDPEIEASTQAAVQHAPAPPTSETAHAAPAEVEAHKPVAAPVDAGSTSRSSPREGLNCRLITFLSAKGGVGTSSVCLNVASQLARLEPDKHMAVLDLVLPIGSLTQITGMEDRFDLVKLTQMDAAELTSETLRGKLPYQKAWGFHLVPGTEHPRRAAHLDVSKLPLVIDKLRAAFDYLIVDIGRNLSRISRIVIDESELLVMVLSPIPAVVENTRAVLESLEEEGISGTRFFILTNRPVGAENMSSEALENILGREVNAGVPRMGQPFTLANTLHVPLHLRFPDDATTLIIQGVSVSIQERLQENEQIFGRP